MTQLPYRLSFNPYVVQELVRIGAPACFRIELSDRELTILRSCIAAGANIYYPEISDSIEHWIDSLEAGCMECCDEILNALSLLDSKVDAVRTAQGSNGAHEPENTQSGIEDELCGGAMGVVLAMHQKNLDTYEKAEAGTVNSVFELIPKFISAVPIFGSLPFDELFQLVDLHFLHPIWT